MTMIGVVVPFARVVPKVTIMRVRGIVQSAVLAENPPGSELIELVMRVQGVGPGQPRTIVVPYAYLLRDASIDADAIAGHGFEAEVEQESPTRWVTTEIQFAPRRVLRPES